MISLNHQRGATLFVALIFLLIMTLFAVSSVNLSTVNFKIVGNMQAMKYMDAAAQDAIEQVLNDPSYISSPSSQTITATFAGQDYVVPFDTGTQTWKDDTVAGGSYSVEVFPPQCIDSQVATGYSAVVQNIIPEDNTWEIVAAVTDNVTGATATVRQGIEIRMLSGNCPDP